MTITYPPEMLPSPDEGQEADIVVVGPDGKVIVVLKPGDPMVTIEADPLDPKRWRVVGQQLRS